MNENCIENYLKKVSEANGFLCFKFKSPGNNGVPDRILIGHGKTIFVETKAPGKKPRKLQQAVHKEMREYGAIVYTLDTIEKIDEFIKQETK